jgi:GAF domain-containing protein
MLVGTILGILVACGVLYYSIERKIDHDITTLLLIVSQLHGKRLRGESPQVMFSFILEHLLLATGSEYGFIGDVVRCENQDPYLKTWAITDIAWSKETKEFYESGLEKGLDFRNLDSLFGEVIKTERKVISNTPKTDPRSGGNLPEGHPPLKCFLGLPILYAGEMIGMVGVANRPGGYDDKLVNYLSPLMTSLGSLLMANRRSEGCC